MRRSAIDIWVGLFVIIGVAALLFLALKAGNLLNLNFQPTYDVTARFQNIGGLKPQTAVKSSGVVVGRVDSIAFDDKRFQASVKLSLDKRFNFPKDSSLKILTSGLLGEQYIGIEPGAEEKNLQAGDVISSTQSAVVLENLIGQFLYSKAEEGSAPGNSSGGASGGASGGTSGGASSGAGAASGGSSGGSSGAASSGAPVNGDKK